VPAGSREFRAAYTNIGVFAFPDDEMNRMSGLIANERNRVT
jgi:hypothetical protein